MLDDSSIIEHLEDLGIGVDLWSAMSPEEKSEVREILSQLARDGYSDRLCEITESTWDTPPPDVRTILTDPHYLGGIGGGDLYPCLVDDMVEIFTTPAILEVILTGSIGWGKSYFAALGMAIEIILLLHLRDPQSFCGVAKGTKISIVNMSVTAQNAESVLYGKVYEFLSNCPWIRENHPINDRTGVFFRTKNIEFRPGSSSEMAVIGEDLIGAALDEANFMIGSRRSKRAILAGEHDVAKIIYDAIARRRISRFVGVLDGTVVPPARMWLISSKQFPGDFLEKKIDAVEALRRSGEPVRTKILNYSQWDTRLSLPPDKIPYCGKWFAVFIGDAMHESRIIRDGEEFDTCDQAVASYSGEVPSGCRVIGVPIEYKPAFIEDIYGAIRDFAGYAILASRPFFSDIPAFADMIVNEEIGDCKGRSHPYEFVETDIVDADLFRPERVLVGYDGEGQAIPLINPDEPRFAHFDQSITDDATGFAICHFGGWKDLKIKGFHRYVDHHGEYREEIVDMIERRPIVICDFMIRVKPPVGGRINLDGLRQLLYVFQRLSGIRKFWKVTYDQFESEAQIAALRSQGYTAERFSVDRNSGAAYGYLRSAISDRRFSMYRYEPFIEDLSSIERTAKGKVDHRQGGSKDVADCVAACCYHVEEKYQSFRLPLIPDAGKDDVVLTKEQRFRKHTQPGHMEIEEFSDFDPLVVDSLIGDGRLW